MNLINLSTIVLLLILFNDDLEINNPIGTRRVVHKVEAFYLTILGIPEKFSSQLKNIFILQLYSTEFHKDLGNDIIFENIIAKLTDLVDNGIINNNSLSD